MGSRLIVVLLGGFWAVMTTLLWRTEFAGAHFEGTPIHPDIVWRKILTSPDSSSLAIIRKGQRLGFCHIITGVISEGDTNAATSGPVGLYRGIEGYRVDLSGSISVLDHPGRLRFDGELDLDLNLNWTEFQTQFIARPLNVEIESNRARGVVRFKVENGDYAVDRNLRLEQLGHPDTVLADILGPAGPLMLGALPFPIPRVGGTAPDTELEWEALADRMKIGRSTAQIYRLEAMPMEGWRISILVSRAGEILRVDLPDTITLVNEALTGL